MEKDTELMSHVYLEVKSRHGLGAMVQMVEPLPSNREALSLIPSTEQSKIKKKQVERKPRKSLTMELEKLKYCRPSSTF